MQPQIISEYSTCLNQEMLDLEYADYMALIELGILSYLGKQCIISVHVNIPSVI